MMNKIPNKLLKLLEKRKNFAEELLVLEAKINEMIVGMGIEGDIEYITFTSDFGCMLYTEPYAYYKQEIEIIERLINNE